jgi:AAHS family 3-hydroxyphenylpropionic acid transporter
MTTDEPTEATARHAPGLRVVLLCALVAILEGFDLQVIGVAAPAIAADLHIASAQTGFAFSASLVGLALGAIVGGRLADRLGRKPVLLGAVACFAVFTLATALADSFGVLVALRFLTGLGLGGSMPNIIAIVSEAVSRRRVTFAVAAMACGLSAGGVVVAQLARILGPDSSWHVLFAIGGTLPLLLLPLLALGLRETCPVRDRTNASRPGIGAALFDGRQAPITLALWVVFALTLLQLSLLLNWLPSLVIAKGFARTDGYLAATVFNLGGIVGSLVIGWLCDRFGARGPMLGVFAVMAVSFWAIAGAGTLGLILWASGVAGFAVLGAQFVLYGLSPRLYPDATRGTGVGAAVAVGRVGAIVGPMLAGAMIAGGTSPDALMMRLIPLVLIASAAMAWLAHAAGARLVAQTNH